MIATPATTAIPAPTLTPVLSVFDSSSGTDDGVVVLVAALEVDVAGFEVATGADEDEEVAVVVGRAAPSFTNIKRGLCS